MKEETRPTAESPAPLGPLERQYHKENWGAIEYYQPPRLGIIHLLAWITVAAVLMSFNLVLDQVKPEASNISASSRFLRISEAERLLLQIRRSAFSIVQAATLVGGIAFWLDQFRRKPGRLQPGHWMLAINSIAIPGLLALDALRSCLYAFSVLRFIDFVFIIYALFMFLQSAAFAWGAWRLPEFRRWKGALSLLSLEAVGYFITFTAIFLQNTSFSIFRSIGTPTYYLFQAVNYFRYFPAALLFFLMLIDFFQGRRRDWLHWLGASVPVAIACIALATAVARVLIPK
jgi:hypothetical protein